MKNIETKLLKLFDYQRFEKNKELNRIINNVEDKYLEDFSYIEEGNLAFVSGGKNVENYKENEKENEQK